jgi:hypothetical protein
MRNMKRTGWMPGEGPVPWPDRPEDQVQRDVTRAELIRLGCINPNPVLVPYWHESPPTLRLRDIDRYRAEREIAEETLS